MAEQEAASRSVKITPSSKEGVIVVRANGEVELFMGLDTVIERGQLLALGLVWACENDDWKLKVMQRARERVMDAIAEAQRPEGEMEDDGEVIDG